MSAFIVSPEPLPDLWRPLLPLSASKGRLGSRRDAIALQRDRRPVEAAQHPGHRANRTSPAVMSAEFLPNSVRSAAHFALSRVRRLRKRIRKGLSGHATYISPKDLYEIPRLGLQGLASWTLPETLWRPLSRPLGRLYVATHPTRTRKETAQIAALLGGSPAAERIYAIAAANAANRYEERFHYLRAWRPGGWTPAIDIEGTEHVSAAIAKGHGIIFWGGNFAFNNLLPKMALRRLGLDVTGFSVPLHGISPTRFGIRHLNRLYRDIEDRYLQERLMPKPQEFAAALDRMRDRLMENGAVYFAVGGRGRRTTTARFLEGNIVVATGPVAMAQRTGAALLPLYTFRIGPGRFQVTIGPALSVPEDGAGNADYGAAIQAYADALGPFVLRDPGQWHGWHLTREREPWGGKQGRMSPSQDTLSPSDSHASQA